MKVAPEDTACVAGAISTAQFALLINPINETLERASKIGFDQNAVVYAESAILQSRACGLAAFVASMNEGDTLMWWSEDSVTQFHQDMKKIYEINERLKSVMEE